MKKFVVHLSNKQKDLMSKELITAHVTYLKELKESGVLPFCGPCLDDTALMIIEAETFDDAVEFVENDPFSKVNYYIDRKIVEVEEANIENNFLIDEVLCSLPEGN